MKTKERRTKEKKQVQKRQLHEQQRAFNVQFNENQGEEDKSDEVNTILKMRLLDKRVA
jgi:hypothetical protein